MSKPSKSKKRHRRNQSIYIGKAYDYWQEYKLINKLNTDTATAFRLLSICSEVLGLDAMTKKIAPLGCTNQQTPVSTSSRDASTQITQKPADDSRLGNEDNPQSDDDNQQIDDDSPQPSDNHPQVDDDHSQTDLDPNQPNKKLRGDPAFDHHCSGLAAGKPMLNSTSTATSGTSSPSHTLDCNPTLKLGRNENGSVSESSCLTMTIKCEVETDVNEDLYEVKDEFSSPTHNNRLDRESELVEIPGKLDCNEATDKPLCMEKEFDVNSMKEESTLDIFDTGLESTDIQRNTCQHFTRSPTRQDQLTQQIRTHTGIHYDDESSSDIFDTDLESTEKQRNTCQHFTRSPTRQDQLTQHIRTHTETCANDVGIQCFLECTPMERLVTVPSQGPPKASTMDPPKASPMNPPKASTMDPPKASPMDPPKASPVDPPKAFPMDPPEASPMDPPEASPMDPPAASPVAPLVGRLYILPTVTATGYSALLPSQSRMLRYIVPAPVSAAPEPPPASTVTTALKYGGLSKSAFYRLKRKQATGTPVSRSAPY